MARKSMLELVATSPVGKVLASTPVAKSLAATVGFGEAATLRRGRVLPSGPIALASIGDGDLARLTLDLLGVDTIDAVVDTPEARSNDERGRSQPPRYSTKLGALVVDLTGLASVADLEQLRGLLRPAVRGLGTAGRVVLLARAPETIDDLEARVVAQGLDGVNRTVAKELRAGSTSNLVWVDSYTTPQGLASTLWFLLEGRSAYVDGQSWRVGAGSPGVEVTSVKPFDGRIVVVTGAARGIGAAIARTMARDGARLVCVDVPAAGEALAQVANEVRGLAVQLDITAFDAGERIASAVVGKHGDDARIHAIVHNAGITRDRMLANLDELLWASVLEVNLSAQLRMNASLLDPATKGGLADGGRIVGISSTSGIAGNKGQANYAASKAAIIGLVEAMAPELADRGITVNAVGPGFINTEMTAAIPYAQRVIFAKSNSLQQGGEPVDVAETIAYLADPASQAVTGQVVRVCGQALVGQ